MPSPIVSLKDPIQRRTSCRWRTSGTGRNSGLRVAQVMPQSPAVQSGLRVGDIVLSVAGEPIASITALQRAMVEDAIGRRLEITVWRNGALVDVIAVPRELADA